MMSFQISSIRFISYVCHRVVPFSKHFYYLTIFFVWKFEVNADSWEVIGLKSKPSRQYLQLVGFVIKGITLEADINPAGDYKNDSFNFNYKCLGHYRKNQIAS